MGVFMTSLLLAIALVAQSAPLADFTQRIQSYVELRARVAQLVPALHTLPDPAEIRRASDALRMDSLPNVSPARRRRIVATT